jgi:hypothetical protein
LSSHFDTKLETHYYSLSHSEGFLSEESYLFVMAFFCSLGFAPPRFAQFCFTSLAGQKTNIPPTLLLVARCATVNTSRLTACNLTAFEGGNLKGTPSK